MGKVHFREASQEKDSGLLFEMINESYLPDDGFFQEGLRIAKFEEMKGLFEMGKFFLMVEEVDEEKGEEKGKEEVVGCAHCTLNGKINQLKRMKFKLLTIKQSCKGRGLASKLINFCHEHAREVGCSFGDIDVVSVKPWLIKVYEKYGYRVIGEIPWHAEHTLKLPTYFVLMEVEF